MSGNYVINIGRQLGSGGKEIGEKLAARLGINFYDKELINLASEESGLSFINQLPIVYCFPVYHSPYILLFSLTHCHFFLLLSVSLHSSEQIVPL